MPNDFDPWGSSPRRPDNNDTKKNDNDQQPPRNTDSPPSLEEVLGKLLSLFNKPSGAGNGKGPIKDKNQGMTHPYRFVLLIALGALLLWFVLGFYVIDQQERGVALRLGKFYAVLEPGLRWQPYMIDQVARVNVTRVREQQFDGEMLTEDENIVDIKSSVQYVIKDPRSFVLAIRSPEEGLSLATDSALRHVVGSSKLDDVITTGREQLGDEVQTRVQDYLDNYNSGLLISKVNILESKAPDEVKGAFDDVIKAREDKVRVINEATTYENGIIPEARGRAKRIFEESAGYREATIAKAEGEAERFSKLAEEYILAPEVTRTRLYIQAIEEVLKKSSKVLIDTGEGSNNLLYLPLDKLVTRARQSEQQPSPTTAQSVERITDQVLEELQRRQRDGTGSNTFRQGR